MDVVPPPRRRILHGLTGIRFVAALMVLLFHYGSSFARQSGAAAPVATFLSNGYLGVSLFFMLSGFIITYTYDGRLETRGELAGYAIARFSRIYPVYLFVLIVSLPLALASLRPWPAIAVLTMLQSWTVPGSGLGDSWVTQGWTLSVEFFFYLIAPLILFGLRGAGRAVLLALGLLCAVLLPLLWIPSVPPSTLTLPFAWEAFVPIPLLRSVEFLFGVVLCKFFLRYPTIIAGISSTPVAVANVAAIVAILASTRNPGMAGIAIVLTGLLLVQVAATGNWVSHWLSGRLLALLGASSYALYLIQWPVREYLAMLLPGLPGKVLNPVAAVALSVAVFRFWEEPIRHRLRRWLIALGQTPPRDAQRDLGR